jgi:hypothetical protein
VVRAGARFHGDDAAGGQLRAPLGKLVSAQRLRDHDPLGGVDGVHLDLLFCQVDPDSCNLLHGLPLSKV